MPGQVLDRARAERRAADWRIVAVVSLGYTMAGWAMGPVASILPTISSSLDISVSAAGWIMTIYFLMLVGTLLVMGRLGDIVGHGRIFGLGSAVIGLTMLLCGAARSLEFLLIARGLQGVGSAMVFGTSLAIVASVVPARSRGKAIGVLTMTQALASLLGVWLATWSVQHLEWHWAFFLPAPIGLISAYLGLRMRLPAAAISRRLDWQGGVLLFATLTAALLALNHFHEGGESFAEGAPYHVGMHVMTLGLFAVFLRVERSAESPLLSFKLLRDLRFSSGVLGNGIAHMSMLATGFLMPFLLERGRGLSPAETGPLLISQQVTMLMSSLALGYLYDRFRSPLFAASMLASMGGALLALSAFGGDLSYPALVGLACVLGMSLGGFSTVNNTAVMGLAPDDQRGFASGLVETTRQLGHGVGVSLSSSFVAGALASALLPEAMEYVSGFSQATLAMGLIAGVGVLVQLWPTILDWLGMSASSGRSPVQARVATPAAPTAGHR